MRYNIHTITFQQVTRKMDGQQQQQQQQQQQEHGYRGAVRGGGGGIVSQAAEDLQNELNTLMDVLEEIQDKIPEGEYYLGFLQARP